MTSQSAALELPHATHTGRCPSSYGELLQGVLPDGRHFLVTIPIHLFSEVVFEGVAKLQFGAKSALCEQDPDSAQIAYSKSSMSICAETSPAQKSSDLASKASFATPSFVKDTLSSLHVEPPSKRKTKLFLEKLSREFGLHLSGVATVLSEIPEGKGLSSSTADIVAALHAVENYVGYAFPRDRVQTILREIEPSDGLLYPESVVYDYINCNLIQKLGRIKSVFILSIDEGGMLDTVLYNHKARVFLEEDRALYAELLKEMITAFEQRDIKQIGKIATRSALLNQKFNFKRGLDQAIDLCEKLNGYGVVNTHSGTCLGILLDCKNELLSEAMKLAAEIFPNEQITLYKSL